MKKMFLFLCLALLLPALPGVSVLSGNNLPTGQQRDDRVPLKLYYSDNRGDNFTTTTSNGERDAKNAGYRYARVECYLYRTQISGTVPLKLYYSDNRGDNFTTATSVGERNAIAAGYRYVRDEGYLYPDERRGTIPLKLYYSDTRGDNFTTATAEGERDAKAAGYRYVRIEGYVLPAGGVGGDGGGGGATTNLNLSGTWTVVIQSTGDELQGYWTRTDRWEFTKIEEGKWHVRMTILSARQDREGEMSGGNAVGRSFDETYKTVNDGNGRFRLITPDGKGGEVEMPGTYSQSQFSIAYASGSVKFSYNGKRQ